MARALDTPSKCPTFQRELPCQPSAFLRGVDWLHVDFLPLEGMSEDLEAGWVPWLWGTKAKLSKGASEEPGDANGLRPKRPVCPGPILTPD